MSSLPLHEIGQRKGILRNRTPAATRVHSIIPILPIYIYWIGYTIIQLYQYYLYYTNYNHPISPFKNLLDNPPLIHHQTPHFFHHAPPGASGAALKPALKMRQ